MGTIARRFALAVLMIGAVAVTACAKDETVTSTATTTPVTASSSGGGSGTTEVEPGTDPGEDEDADKDKGSGNYPEACAIIEQIDQSEGDDDLDEGLALFEDAKAASPEELAVHWDKLSEVFAVVVDLDENDPEAITEMLTLMEDPEFLEAASTIDDFASEECGLEIDLDPGDESPGGLTEDTTDTTDPDADPTSIDAVQGHIETNFGSEPWYAVLDENVTWGSSGSGDVSWTVVLGDDPAAAGATSSDLVDVCESMAEYLDTFETGDVDITISGPDEVELVTRAPGEDCIAA